MKYKGPYAVPAADLGPPDAIFCPPSFGFFSPGGANRSRFDSGSYQPLLGFYHGRSGAGANGGLPKKSAENLRSAGDLWQ